MLFEIMLRRNEFMGNKETSSIQFKLILVLVMYGTYLIQEEHVSYIIFI